MKFKQLVKYLSEIEATASRLEMTKILAEMLKETGEEEVDKAVYLALGRLKPKYEGVEFNLAEKMMVRVIGAAYRVKVDRVSKLFKQKGDLGEAVKLVGETGKSKGAGLSVGEVYKRLMAVAMDGGQGSQERKVQEMAGLLKVLDLKSARLVVRIPVNKLRLGFSDMTVLDALSWMKKGDKSLRQELERAFNVRADIGQVAKVFKGKGLGGIEQLKIKPGVPVRMTKAERLPNAEKVVEKLGKMAVEPKFDGLRVQIHMDKGQMEDKDKDLRLFTDKTKKGLVRIYSRNLDNMTLMFPEVVEAVKKLPAKSLILDGEAVGFNQKTGKMLVFQETVQRKRKHGVGEKVKDLPVKVMVYDLLYVDGKSLMPRSFKERRERLERLMKGREDGLRLAEQTVVSGAGELRQLVKKYLNQGLEGAMCKKLDTSYKAGSRNFNWVKFKKTTEGDLADTIDSIVMGYYLGKGRRVGFGIGAFLVGVVDKQGRVGSVAKIGTGLSDQQWKEMKTRCDRIKVNKRPGDFKVNKNLEPDVWVKGEMVVEIMADEITRSPVHAFGLALRFPRLVKFRDDKTVGQATSKKELERLFKLQ